MTSNRNTAIAIVGIAFRFPGGLIDECDLWEALKQKKDLVTVIPDDRWAKHELSHAKRTEPGRSITFSAGVLSRIDEFDAEFFGISPREAVWLDPQQRILLELAWETLENAGVPPSSLVGTNCGVYVGISSLDYGTRGLDDLAAMSPHSMTGNTLSIAANRLSYVFDLHGPSLAIDTACSSSLVALHHACLGLQSGEAELALVGGVNLLLHPYPFVGFTKASMLSADGRCKTFDASGNGYVRAEGGAVLLLKPLDRAIADGDEIQAVILATGVNADGARKSAITIPSRDGQAELMRAVLAKTGLAPQDVDFVEAHGTGTMVGDPIECAAIGEVYGQGRDTPLPIGSIKANLGHMEAASGMAGLVKAILALRHRALPPQIHLKTPNPHIDFKRLNLLPVTEYHAFNKEAPLVAGVNSFGFGGANAHVILREYRYAEGKPYTPEVLPPLFLSARSTTALQALASSYADRLNHCTPEDYYDITYAAAYRRDRLEKRLALLAATSDEAAKKLRAFADGAIPAGLVTEEALAEPGSIAFVYSGNGAQWMGMGRRLLAESARFAELLADLDARIQPVAGFSLLDELQAEGSACRLDDTAVAQPLLFALQVALTQLLKESGIEPAAVAGHSVGEVAAAWAAGAMELEVAIQVIVARSRAQAMTRGSGRMAAVGLSAQVMQEVIDAIGGGLDITIAGFNSPNNVTLSGKLADLERIQAHLAPKGTFFRILDLDYAFHSECMEPIRGELSAGLADLKVCPSSRAVFVSTVTGGVLGGDALGADYWWHNVRDPVRFSDAMVTLARLGCRVFVEIGPHAILQRYIGECLASVGVKGRVLPTLRKEADGWDAITEAALRVHLLAERPRLEKFFPQLGRHVRLPNYPWQRERYWHPRTSESLLSIERRRVHPLLGWAIPEADCAWENVLDPTVLPWLADHKVGGAIVFPGAAYAEMALAAARQWRGGENVAFEEMDIVSPMVFDGEHARTLRLEINVRDGTFTIKSRQRLTADEWTLHAAGRILQTTSFSHPARIPCITTPMRRADQGTHYRLASSLGLEYGPTFQGLREAYLDGEFLEARLEHPVGLDADAYLVHPALLDVCFQSLVDFFQTDIEAGQGVALLPVKIGRLQRYRAGKIDGFRAHLSRRGARSVMADFELFDIEGRLLASVSGCRFSAAPLVHHEQQKVARWRMALSLRLHPLDERVTALPSTEESAQWLRLPQLTSSAERHRWFKEALPLFEALVLSFAYEACQTLAQQDAHALQRLHASDDAYTRWLIGLLKQEGLLLEHEGHWALRDDADLPSAADIWRELVHEHPTCLPQLVLLGRVGRHLPRLLIEPPARQAFLDALWRVPAADILYEDDPAYSGIARAVEGFLLRLAESIPPHRRLRILELAASPSRLPEVLLSALPEDRLAYVLAVPEAAAERQRAEHAPPSNLVIASFDSATWQLTAAEQLPERFDVIIVRHLLHRAAQPKAALDQVQRWLAPGGSLLVAERHPDWSADFLYGLDADWWHLAEDGTPHSKLLPPTVWTQALCQEGFEAVQDFAEPAAEGLAEGTYLIMARRSPHSLAAPLVESMQTWLLLADAATREWGAHLAARLESHGQRVAMAERPSAQNLAGVEHVVYLRGWDAPMKNAAVELGDALDVVRSLATLAGKTPRLWLLTRGGTLAADLPDSCRPNPLQAALWGLGRVVMNEYPALECTLIDIAYDPHAVDTLSRVENELLHPDGANEIVLADRGRYVPVLREVEETSTAPARREDRFRLDFHLPGQLKNLRWLPQQERALQEGEVEVRVQATGLNFRDVMYLMGLLPDEAVEKGFAGASLGLEFAGTVTRVGPRVRDFKAGDKVMGFGSSCFASHVVTRADALALMPDGWSFEAAATVPTVFFTVYYALKHLANLQAGERVLIHGAAGGVGIAAIQLAQYLGAEIFATAGSDEKRDFIHLLGADHVFDSRNLSFADAILAITQGEGVDVVLNSLAGEAMRRSLAVLKPFGRFLELGKRDFFENTPVGLRPFKDNISYFGIDADQLLTARPQLAARLLREVMAMFREGVFHPLPCRVFPAERVVEAFRVMQQARHIGKVVVTLTDARPPIVYPPAAPQALDLSSESTWLVTGGLSGFGLESARWLASRGVGCLVLVSRRGPETPDAKEAIEALSAQGVRVEAFACDITEPQVVSNLIERILSTLPPLKGVLHAAATFDDALLANLDAQRMQAVVAPKLLGAWNLHQATLDIPLEHFVLYSSITTAIGNPGQANYVAANAGLEGLAALRRAMGLPAVCIAWGPIGDAGYLARNPDVKEHLAQRLGKAPLTVRQALAALDQALCENATRILCNFDWNTLARLLPSAGSPRFAALNRHLKSGGPAQTETDIRALIVGKTPQEAATLVQALVIQELAQILAIAPERIDPARGLHDLGMDSLMAVELALALEQRIGLQFPAMMLNESPSVEKVAQRIVDKLIGSGDQADLAAGSVHSVEAVIQGMSQQHGETLKKEDIQQIAHDVRRLQTQGKQLTS